MHRYPENTQTTAPIAIAALLALPEIADKELDCAAFWQRLSDEARTRAEAAAPGEPDWPVIKALWMIADACSLMLKGDSTNAPFGPLAVFGEHRSAISEDFTPADAALMSEVAAAIDQPALRARLADLAWLRAKPKKIADALLAIDTYRSTTLTEDNEFTVMEAWRRAITLCLQLRKGAGDRLEQIEAALVALAITQIPADGLLGKRAAQTLLDRRLGDDAGEQIAGLLAERAEKQIAASQHFFARNCFSLASDWYARLENLERAADMTVAIALSFEAEADERIAQQGVQGHMVAGSFFEDAVQVLRKVPGDQRESRQVAAHLERLRLKIERSGPQALKGMATISTDPIDIRDLVRQAEERVSGQPPLHALLYFAHLHHGANAAELEAGAKKTLREYPVSSMFGASHYSRDGRVIAKTAGGVDDSEAGRVFSVMMRHYLLEVELVCRGQILPAAAVITREHLVRQVDLSQLMRMAPIVPPGRSEQFAKGLWEGFEHDFATATYLLAPQVEHLVRWQLKQQQVRTSTIDADGIENEIGLSALVETPAMKTTFGEDLTFELKALFCSAIGPNLRNQVAHGLLDARECNTTSAVYAWWWVLRLTLRSFHAAARPPAVDPAGERADASNNMTGPGKSA
ncbi:DUF4209 domain-containing protein [Roseateles sp.]|uniref:DUF4209 domain-containing protein n=1 Tax=Roseateles sp. TaxID=1971397 RepID=UPI0031D2BF52